MVAGPVVMEEPSLDDMTIGLQMQQFFDEWHYRLLHSGLAYEMDRNDCVIKALDMFTMHGVEMTPEEKAALADMPDEADMIRRVVSKMTMPNRKTFEHFALQLQLVVSCATRVRHALEEGSPEEVARVMEDGDAGIGQQVLKQAVTEACVEVGSLAGCKDSWVKNMESRIGRLLRCADDAANAKQQLEAISAQLQEFGGEQRAKSKNVLMTMCAGQDKAMMTAAWRAWVGYFIKYQADSAIHKKFRLMIEDSEKQLIEYQAKQLNNVRGVLMRKAKGADDTLMIDIIQLWQRVIQREKEELTLAEQNKQLQAKLEQYNKDARDNCKKVMARMAAGNDSALVTLCLQSWIAHFVSYTMNKEFEDQVRATETGLKAYMEKKSGEAKKVMMRMMEGTDTGMVYAVMSTWGEMYREEKKQREFEEQLNGAQFKLSNLNARQKKAAKNTADRANKREEENFLTQVFNAWSTEAKMDRIVRHYQGKMDGKKNQLQAVQSMFQSFAVQLEEGMSGTPRSQRRSQGRKERGPPPS